jgi:hypothetical protein
VPRASPLAAPLAALALLAGGCAKDLELPPRSTAPVLGALSPAAAYAGQLVRLQGSGLDPDPGANVVTFAAATARGLRFDGASLVVRVPEDAGTGPVIVTNGRGTSAPFGAFGYLGEGEPKRRAVGGSLPVLHGPTAVYGIGGDVFIDSTVYDGLLSSGHGAFSTPHADLSASDGVGAVFTAEYAATASAATLWRVDAVSGARTGPRSIPFYPTALVAMQGVDLLVAFASSGPLVAAWDLATLDPILAATEVPGVGDYLSGAAADVRDGRAVVAAYDPAYDHVTLALLDLRGVRAGAPFPPAALLPGQIDPPLDARVAVAVANAAAPADGIALGEALAAVTLAGDDLRVARLGADPAFVGTVEIYSPSPIQALAGASTLPVVLATKPRDGLSVGADLLARRLVWSIPGDGPGPASASGDVAVVAHAGGNEVSVVDLANGTKVAQVSFDVVPTRGNAASWAGGLAFVSRDRTVLGSEDLLFFASGQFPGLLRFSLGSGTAACLLRGTDLGPVAASPGEPALWVAQGGSTVLGELPAAALLLRDRGAAAPVAVPLPGVAAITDLAPAGTSLALGHRVQAGGGAVGAGGGLALLSAAGLSGSVSTDGLGLVGLGHAPDGRLWAVPRLGGGSQAQLWDPASLATGGAPDLSQTFDSPSAALSTAWLEDGLWVLGRGTVPQAVLLGPDLAVARTVLLAGDAPAGAVPSPNGRLLVEASYGATDNQTIVRFYRADPELGFPLLDSLVLDGYVEGLTFDPTGERLWIVTRGPDRIVLVD